MKNYLILVIILIFLLTGCTGKISCTEEAKICPDETAVSRDASLNCRFDACPIEKSPCELIKSCNSDKDCEYIDGTGGCHNKGYVQSCIEESMLKGILIDRAPPADGLVNCTCENKQCQTRIFDKNNLEFSFSYTGCEDTIGVRDKSKLGVKETKWVNHDLYITAFVLLNCAESILDGRYNISGNIFTLGYNRTKCKTCTSCNCVHQLGYVFKNVEKKNYSFELKSYYYEENLPKNVDKITAIQKLLDSGCWYSLSHEEECIFFDEPSWTIQKEGCFGKCVLNSLNGEVTIDSNQICTGLLIPCESDTDCSSIKANCASKYICSHSYCRPVYSRECFTEEDCIDIGDCKPELECMCKDGKCYQGLVA